MTTDRRTILFAALAALSASGLPSAAEAARRKHDRVLLVTGQSLTSPWNSAYMRRAFEKGRRARGDTAPWYYVVSGSGSSAALREFCQSEKPDNWWFDAGTRKPGPCLRAAVAAVKAAKTKPTEILWIQGQQEGRVFTEGRFGLTDAEFKARYKVAVVGIARVLRRACGRGPIPFYVQMVGTRASGDRYGDGLVREAQAELVAELGARLNIRLGAVQPRDLPLLDDVHPNPIGYRELARRTARAIDLAPSL